MNSTRIHFQWSAEKPQARFGTGVSLHSHTLHSRELLDFIYRIARHCAPARWALRRSEARYQFLHGVPLDLSHGWWTPPLGPRDAYSVEFDQISSLGLDPIVSLTDHDPIVTLITRPGVIPCIRLRAYPPPDPPPLDVVDTDANEPEPPPHSSTST